MLLILNKQTNKVDYAFSNLEPYQITLTKEKLQTPIVDSTVSLYTHYIKEPKHPVPASYIELYSYTDEDGFSPFDKEQLAERLERDLQGKKSDRLKELKALRKSSLEAGLELNNTVYSVDDSSKSALTSIFLLAPDDQVTEWKLPSGEFITLSKTQVGEVLSEVIKFIDKCFKKEKSVAEVISSSSLEELVEIDIKKLWSDT